MNRDLDIEIQRRGRRADEFSVNGDPDDPAAMRRILTDWLRANKWDEGHWPGFELLIRRAGEFKIRGKVRA